MLFGQGSNSFVVEHFSIGIYAIVDKVVELA